MIHGVAEFYVAGTPSFVQAAIVPSTVTAGTFDDYSQLTQFTNTLSGQTFMIVTPMRYYCGSVTKTFEIRAVCAAANATANHTTNYTSVLRAVRVG